MVLINNVTFGDYFYINVDVVFLRMFFCAETRNHACNTLVFVLVLQGGGGGMSSNTLMSRPGMGSVGQMGGGYAGAKDMVNNGLSPSQNQVNIHKRIVIHWWVELQLQPVSCQRTPQ